MSLEEEAPRALKLCLIYAPEDQALYVQLEKQLQVLERHGMVEFWDVQQVFAGSDREQTRAAQLAAADIVVYLLSSDLLASDECSPLRLQHLLERYKRGEVRIVPVILRPIVTELLDPPFSELEPLPEGGKPATIWQDRDLALVDIALGILGTVKSIVRPWLRAISAETPPVNARKLIWAVPYRRNPYFTGRVDLLTTLHQRLHTVTRGEQALVALTGLAGSGKTSLALEYACRHQEEYEAILWARADSPENLATDGLRLARVLQLPERDNPEQERVLAALKLWLQQQTRWLFVFDNVTDLNVVADFLPAQYSGQVVITTRLQATGGLAPALPVPMLAIEEGIHLLLLRAQMLVPGEAGDTLNATQAEQAREVVQLLDGLPLALEQAGAYIEEMGETLDGYLLLYRRQRSELLRYRGQVAAGHTHTLPVGTTFALALEQVEQISSSAAELLRLCAFLHPATIPETLLVNETSQDESPVLACLGDRYTLNTALKVLLMFSLVQRNSRERTVSVHRLVQEVTRDTMHEQEQQHWAKRAVSLVSRAWPVAGIANWKRCQDYLPHALACADLIERYNLSSDEALHLLSAVGMYLGERAAYQEAERLLLSALALSEILKGSDDLATADVLQELGWLAHRRNMYALAEERYQRALAIRSTVSGPEHLLTLATLYKLGLLYLNRRELERAEELLPRVLALQEQQLGAQHLTVAETLNALGMLYRARGWYEQAATSYRRALAIREQQLGPDAPETATSVSNLATLAFNQERYAEAEPLYQRVLAMRERVLGADHPESASTLSTLAELYYQQRKNDEAEVLALRALSIQEATLGREHRETAQTLRTLAMLSLRQGNYQWAQTLGEEVLAVRERILNPHDPNLITSFNDLALIYRAQEKNEQARALLRRALILSEQEHGREHDHTKRIRANLTMLSQSASSPTEDDASPA
jgi:Tfp pilus assembly protein PilF